MTREQLEHVIRAAGSLCDTKRLVVFGSQAVLGASEDLPPLLTRSMEVDTFPEDDPAKCDVIDGAIGELSPFHETFGYYAHGIGPEAAILPEHWRSRLVAFTTPAMSGCTALCLSPDDLAVSKLLAGREKDIAFVREMLRAGLTSASRIHRLADELSDEHAQQLREALPSA